MGESDCLFYTGLSFDSLIQRDKFVVKVTINSDDPAYFFGHVDKFGEEHDGYVESCYYVTAKEVGLTADELVCLSFNSFQASFITPGELAKYQQTLKEYCESFVA